MLMNGGCLLEARNCLQTDSQQDAVVTEHNMSRILNHCVLIGFVEIGSDGFHRLLIKELMSVTCDLW